MSGGGPRQGEHEGRTLAKPKDSCMAKSLVWRAPLGGSQERNSRRHKESTVYIGVGTVVVILLIIIVVMLMRRRV